MRRGLFAAAVVLTGLFLQVGLVNPLDLPGGHPNLPLVCVVALALAGGPTYGVGLGFIVGLVADVMPPADHTLGLLALAYAVVGYLSGLVEDVEERSVLSTVGLVALATAVAVIAFGGLSALLGDDRVTVSSLGHALVAAVIYDVVLAPFIVPLVAAAMRRVEPAA